MAADASTSPDLVAIKGRQQLAWAAGDYARVGATFVLEAELLCEAVDLEAGQRVLDVAGGSGNASLAAARRFADVTCTDYVPALLDQARTRADVEGFVMTFQQADAENLPFPDASFDVVLSTFGAMFAPDQAQVARELLRVCRPGGKIGMTNWPPEGFAADVFRATARYVPPLAGVASPLRWGTEAGLAELFGDGIRDLTTRLRQHTYRFCAPEHFVSFFRSYYGPTTKAFEALDAARQAQLATELEDLVRRYNRGGEQTAIWSADYLEVVAVRA